MSVTHVIVHTDNDRGKMWVSERVRCTRQRQKTKK